MAKYTPKTRDELKKLVQDESIYLGDIDTSNITDMSKLFMGWGSTRKDFSGIESWDTSNVVTMKYMFHSVKTFNCNINDWNVSKVVDMSFMFALADSFNQPLNKWDTSSVVSMYGMFFRAKSFNQPLDNWDASSVEFMTRMFERAESFNQNIDSWDVSSIRDNQQMFWDSGINKLPKWHKKRAIVDLADLAVSDIVEWGDRDKKIYSIKDNLVAEAIANPRPKKPKIAPQDKPQSNRANDSVSTWLGLDDIKPPSKGKVILSAIVLIAIIAVPRIIDTIEDWQNKNKATTQNTQPKQQQPAQQPTINMPRCDDRGLLNHIIQSYKNFLVDAYNSNRLDEFVKEQELYRQHGINLASAEEYVNSFKYNLTNVQTKTSDKANKQVICEVEMEIVYPMPRPRLYATIDYRAQLTDNNSIEFELLDMRGLDK